VRGGEDHRTVDSRGSAESRRRRRAHLIDKHGFRLDGERGIWVACHHCAAPFRASSRDWQVDRFPIPGHAGGRYTRDNIVISCGPCNGGRFRLEQS